MFDLEPAIVAWRQQMLASGIQTPVPLEELESHLREDVEQLQRSGLNARRAFETAAQQIGPAAALKREFNKEKPLMKRALLIFAGLLIAAVGMAFVTPALAQYHDQGGLSREEMFLLPLGIVLALAGLGMMFLRLKRKHA